MQAGPFVIGAEAGIGGGGKAVRQTGTRGQYLMDPGLTYDLTARAGVVGAPGALLYGRVGYRWLQIDRTTTPTAGSPGWCASRPMAGSPMAVVPK